MSDSEHGSNHGGGGDDILDGLCDELIDACWPWVERHKCLFCCIVTAIAVLATVIALAVSYGVAHPVRAVVKHASVTHLAAVAGNNATALAPATTSYGIALTITVRNPNMAMRAVHAAPLDAEFRVAGRRFGGAVRVANAGRELPPKETAHYRVETAGELHAEETPFAGMLRVEVALAGEVAFSPWHPDRRALAAVCSLHLHLPPPPPPGTAEVMPVFDPVKCVAP